MDHNPYLAVGNAPSVDKGGPATIEVPEAVENVVWQTRPAPLTEGERALADALQAIFADAEYDLPRLVERLNASGVRPPEGATAWTEDGFRAEIARLGV